MSIYIHMSMCTVTQKTLLKQEKRKKKIWEPRTAPSDHFKVFWSAKITHLGCTLAYPTVFVCSLGLWAFVNHSSQLINIAQTPAAPCTFPFPFPLYFPPGFAEEVYTWMLKH